MAARIIAELNDRFGLDLTEDDRVCLEQAMEKLDQDTALDASARANTRENIRLTFNHKLEDVVQRIVESNFDLYKRITDDKIFAEALADRLFDNYLRNHREADELLKENESKTLEFKSTLRWDLREERKNPQIITVGVLKTIGAFLNTEGGDLLIGVGDDKSIVGIEPDGFENDDKFLLHLTHVVQAAFGQRAATCIDPKTQIVNGKTICLASCQRSPEPVFFKWRGWEEYSEGDFYVRAGPQTSKLTPEAAQEYIRTRFPVL